VDFGHFNFARILARNPRSTHNPAMQPFPAIPLPESTAPRDAVHRRAFLRQVALLAGTGSALLTIANSRAQTPRRLADPAFRISHGRIRQSIMGWTYNPMPTLELARLCKEIGLVAMEGIDAADYARVRDLGLEISLVGSHGFARGPFNPINHGHVIQALREGIDLAVACGSTRVITFTGMREQGITDEEGANHCVNCWKQVVGYAEEKRVTLCLEHLNSRDDTHPMKGHPGYFGDDVDLCIDLIRRVGSPRFKLLFDIYHVQVMNGDVIRRIRLYHEFIAHYHTAGAPGRGELDETQEINYPAVMRAILDTGYEGYVAQEFIPTWDDRALALRHAAMVCDV
jgi:hydroxypyruvate isomerase